MISQPGVGRDGEDHAAPQLFVRYLIMFLPSKFYIHKENSTYIELREKKLKLFFGSLLIIAFGFVCLFQSFLTESRVYFVNINFEIAILNVIGVLLILFGVIPTLSVGKVIIDGQGKSLLFYGGVRKFLFSPLKYSFSQINRIEIKEQIMFRYGFAIGWTKIILKLNGFKEVEIDHSSNDEYISEMVHKMSHLIGCGVFHKN